jgi:hypothetical protein
MEHENAYASKGIGGTALGLAIGGLGTQFLGGGLGNLFGGKNACPEDHMVTRFEAEQSGKIAELQTQVKLLESNIYTDQKIADVYERLGARIGAVEASVNQQAVINAQITANLGCMQANIAALQGLTKTIIPIGNICPPPMEKFNSWTAPNAAATT